MTYTLPPWGLGLCAPVPKKRKAPTPESRLKKALIEYLHLLPWVAKVNRHNVGMAWMGANHQAGYRGRPVVFSERGHSDLSVEIKGSPLVVWIEIKAPGARTQKAHLAEQEAFLARKRASGHPAFFCAAGEVLRTELKRASLPAPCAQELADDMRRAGAHPATVRAFLARMRLAFFAVPIKANAWVPGD